MEGSNDVKEPIETHEANGEEIKMPVSNRYTMSERELENEKHYRKQREYEMKDDLALRIMNLVNDTNTGQLKELAADYLAKRFK